MFSAWKIIIFQNSTFKIQTDLKQIINYKDCNTRINRKQKSLGETEIVHYHHIAERKAWKYHTNPCKPITN
jgi:hypothetical protein